MTINIAISVAEGIVMAADSMAQMSANNQVVGTHGSVEKLTELRGVSMAAMANGLGAISSRTILSLIREFEFDEYLVNQGAAYKTYSVDQMSQKLADYIAVRYNAAFPDPPQPHLGIFVGGYTPGQFFPELVEINFPGPVLRKLHPQPGAVPGGSAIHWAGVKTSLNRLILGADSEMITAVHNLAVSAAQPGFVAQPGAPPLPPPTAMDPMAFLAPYLPLIQMPHNLTGMPLEEAAEFADYLGTVAIGWDKFTVGPPAVGGALDVLAIQPEGLAWYKRKEFAEQMARARRG